MKKHKLVYLLTVETSAPSHERITEAIERRAHLDFGDAATVAFINVVEQSTAAVEEVEQSASVSVEDSSYTVPNRILGFHG